MNRIIALVGPAIAAIAVATPVLAQQAICVRYAWQGWRRVCVQWGTSTTSNVPEINAGAGLLALAAVAAVVLFVWERRHRTA